MDQNNTKHYFIDHDHTNPIRSEIIFILSTIYKLLIVYSNNNLFDEFLIKKNANDEDP